MPLLSTLASTSFFLRFQDVAISPAWQRGGLGRALLERLTAKLVKDDIPTITLVRAT